MNKEKIIELFSEYAKNNKQINRFSIIELRPASVPIFNKGIRNIAHVISNRELDNPIDIITEGSDILTPVTKLEEFMEDNFNKIKLYINNIKSTMDLTIFFQCPTWNNEDSMGGFVIEIEK